MSQLDYALDCVKKDWKGHPVNRKHTNLVFIGYGHYCFKETIENPYSYQEWLKEQSEKQMGLIELIKKFYARF